MQKLDNRQNSCVRETELCTYNVCSNTFLKQVIFPNKNTSQVSQRNLELVQKCILVMLPSLKASEMFLLLWQ